MGGAGESKGGWEGRRNGDKGNWTPIKKKKKKKTGSKKKYTVTIAHSTSHSGDCYLEKKEKFKNWKKREKTHDLQVI